MSDNNYETMFVTENTSPEDGLAGKAKVMFEAIHEKAMELDLDPGDILSIAVSLGAMMYSLNVHTTKDDFLDHCSKAYDVYDLERKPTGGQA